MGLFATMPIEEVTVQDIAGAVDMTSAAVYYHFASKEEILIEGLKGFCDELLTEVREHSSRAEVDGVRDLMVHLLEWARRNRDRALVYFVSSIGLNLMVEALRRQTRLDLVDELRDMVAREGRRSRAEAGVIAVALVSLLETGAASLLNQDATYRGLGARRYTDEVGAIAERIAGGVAVPT